MAETNQSTVKVTHWPGQMSNVDPHELPPGAAQIQENAVSVTRGTLEPRKGWRKIVFETGTASRST